MTIPSTDRRWKVAGVNFDHFHMGDNLRMAVEHPQVDLVGLYDDDSSRIIPVARGLGISEALIYDNCEQLIETTKPDIVLLCPASARHAEWVDRVVRPGQLLLIEKPFAGSLAEARRMIAISESRCCQLAINWPLAWSETIRTAYEMCVEQQVIGDLIGFNYYGGNRGPLWHTFDKIEITADEVAKQKPNSWFYQRNAGGGSLLDYLGYGATLGSWFLQGREPIDITTVVDRPQGLEVDEHSISVCRYDFGLSRMETRWGTFTDPWTHRTLPPTGFTLFGTNGVIQCSDYAETIEMQNRDHPEGIRLPLNPTFDRKRKSSKGIPLNPIEFVIEALETERPISGPLGMPINILGQRIIDTAMMSSIEERTVALVP